MKKLLSVLFALFLCLTLTGCTGGDGFKLATYDGVGVNYYNSYVKTYNAKIDTITSNVFQLGTARTEAEKINFNKIQKMAFGGIFSYRYIMASINNFNSSENVTHYSFTQDDEEVIVSVTKNGTKAVNLRTYKQFALVTSDALIPDFSTLVRKDDNTYSVIMTIPATENNEEAEYKYEVVYDAEQSYMKIVNKTNDARIYTYELGITTSGLILLRRSISDLAVIETLLDTRSIKFNFNCVITKDLAKKVSVDSITSSSFNNSLFGKRKGLYNTVEFSIVYDGLNYTDNANAFAQELDNLPTIKDFWTSLETDMG